MELTFSQLKQKDVVCVYDGKHLGKVIDLLFNVNDYTLKGIYVTGCKGFKLSHQDVFIPIKDVVKMGEDVILTRCGKPPHEDDRHDDCRHDDCRHDDCRCEDKHEKPNNCQNKRPPQPPVSPCNNGFTQQSSFIPNGSQRRNLDEYE